MEREGRDSADLHPRAPVGGRVAVGWLSLQLLPRVLICK